MLKKEHGSLARWTDRQIIEKEKERWIGWISEQMNKERMKMNR